MLPNHMLNPIGPSAITLALIPYVTSPKIRTNVIFQKNLKMTGTLDKTTHTNVSLSSFLPSRCAYNRVNYLAHRYINLKAMAESFMP